MSRPEECTICGEPVSEFEDSVVTVGGGGNWAGWAHRECLALEEAVLSTGFEMLGALARAAREDE